MFRLLLFCSSFVLIIHTTSASPINQIQSEEQVTTTDNTIDVFVQDEEDKADDDAVTETVTEAGTTSATVIIFRQESEEQVEEGEDDSEEEPDEKEPVEVRPSPSTASAQGASSNAQVPEGQVSQAEGQTNQAEGQTNQQEGQSIQSESQNNQAEGQVNPVEGQVNAQEELPVLQQEEASEGQVNPASPAEEAPVVQQEEASEGQVNQSSPQEEAPVVQPDTSNQEDTQTQEFGQISQSEAARPQAKLPSPPSPPILTEDPEYAPNVFPEFGETVIAAREPEPAPAPVIPSGPRPVEHVGFQHQKRPIKKPSVAQLPIHQSLPFGESISQISEFEEENEPVAGLPVSSTTPVPVEITTVRTTPGKYKISPKPTATPGIIKPTTVIPPPGGSFAEEWNNTNTIFMLSPQGRKECECGKVPFKVENADRVGINEYPWTIAVVRTGIFGGGRPHCGGTLINDLYVLSAAHCFSGLYADSIQIWLTPHNTLQSIDNFIPSDRVLKRDVAEILMHPNFDSRNYENDIALIKLSQPVDISTSSYYVPACLPAGVGTYEGMQARVTGWGSAGSSTNSRLVPNKMCRDDVPIIGNEVCNRDTSHKNKITSNHMCAGLLLKVPTETCLGDSGGPLMLPNNGRFTVIGITSHGYTNRRAYSPVVYTRVGNYADWILHNTRDAEWCHL